MIFYFSGTGNTLWAARQISEATGERLMPMGDGAPQGSLHLSDGERIGFCFPVHGWQPPKVVRRFVEGLNIENADGHYCFALCTCGDTVGLAMDIFRAKLAHKGWPLHSVYSLTMPESYIALPFMLTDPPRRERYKLLRASRKLSDVMGEIVERHAGTDKVERGPAAWLLSNVVGQLFNAALITDRPFMVDGAKCNKCGRCAAVCPTHNILGGKGRQPRWLHDGQCTACLSCYHHCPTHAIGYGPLTKRRGQYYYGRNDKT